MADLVLKKKPKTVWASCMRCCCIGEITIIDGKLIPDHCLCCLSSEIALEATFPGGKGYKVRREENNWSNNHPHEHTRGIFS